MPPDVEAGFDLLRVVLEASGRTLSLGVLEGLYEETHRLADEVADRDQQHELSNLIQSLYRRRMALIAVGIANFGLGVVLCYAALGGDQASIFRAFASGGLMSGLGYLVEALKVRPEAQGRDSVDDGATAVDLQVQDMVARLLGKSPSPSSLASCELIVGSLARLRKRRRENASQRNEVRNRINAESTWGISISITIWLSAWLSVIVISVVRKHPADPLLAFVATSAIGIVRMFVGILGVRTSDRPQTKL